ncbi:unnamed protein product [Euphydryas editha]|uniref:Uncharacterized protein n=1 Tax=Euphydryas editha TaxID=104508 RepID=A0AAU9UGW1_EUPED|nr:unnamed protein product [Euphydryas editha]
MDRWYFSFVYLYYPKPWLYNFCYVSNDTIYFSVLLRNKFKRLLLYAGIEARNSVELQTLKRAWNKLLLLKATSNYSIKPQDDFKEIIETMKFFSIGEGCDEQIIKEWLNCYSEYPGFQILTDEEIIDDLNSTEKEDEEETDTGNVCQVPFHAEAFEALDVPFKWFEREDESNPIQLLQLTWP